MRAMKKSRCKLQLILLLGVLLSSLCVKIDASPLLMVDAEGIVDGYVNERISSRFVELTLNDDNYYFDVEDYEDISDWFTNMPEGLEAYVSGHEERIIHVEFEGLVKETHDEMI